VARNRPAGLYSCEATPAFDITASDSITFGDFHRNSPDGIQSSEEHGFASFGAAGLVSVLAILDIVTTFPFAGSMTMDILFLLSAAIVGYLAWDAFKDMT